MGWRAVIRAHALRVTDEEVQLMSRPSGLGFVLSLSVLLLGCSSGGSVRYVSPYPARWVKQQINAYETRAQESTSVTRKVIYGGKPAYLIPSPCCDKFDYLYDSKGVILCAPSGGFAGDGDGSCPEVL